MHLLATVTCCLSSGLTLPIRVQAGRQKCTIELVRPISPSSLTRTVIWSCGPPKHVWQDSVQLALTLGPSPFLSFSQDFHPQPPSEDQSITKVDNSKNQQGKLQQGTLGLVHLATHPQIFMFLLVLAFPPTDGKQAGSLRVAQE